MACLTGIGMPPSPVDRIRSSGCARGSPRLSHDRVRRGGCRSAWVQARNGLAEAREGAVHELVVHPAAAAPANNESGIPQHLEVVAQQARCNRDVRFQRAGADPAVGQQHEDRHPVRIRCGRQQGGCRDRRLVDGVIEPRFSMSRSGHGADRPTRRLSVAGTKVPGESCVTATAYAYPHTKGYPGVYCYRWVIPDDIPRLTWGDSAGCSPLPWWSPRARKGQCVLLLSSV